MNSETRNTKVVFLLVAAMTLGAAVLLWLMPTPPRSPAAVTLLMAAPGTQLDELTIEFCPADASFDPADYDGLIFPDARPPQWEPRGATARLLVVGAPTAGLPTEQARTLLTLLSAMRQTQGLTWERVRLNLPSDPAELAVWPSAAAELRDLLVRKGIAR